MEFEGGCQCGRIRFRAEGPRGSSSVCFCRMCQKASGGPFMAFVRFPIQAVAWTTPPDLFESSNMAERGFCGRCGTPLSYRQTGGRFVSLTLNSLDDPDAVRPDLSLASEQMARWLRNIGDLPGEPVSPTVAGLVSRQVP